jgi:hypothetical protein
MFTSRTFTLRHAPQRPLGGSQDQFGHGGEEEKHPFPVADFRLSNMSELLILSLLSNPSINST